MRACPTRLLLAGTILLSNSAVGQSAYRELPVAVSRFHHDTWGAVDGLPSRPITSIKRTADGYLWLDAGDRIVRFDGVQFRIMLGNDSLVLPDGRVSRRSPQQRFVDADGRLWITFQGGNVVRYAGGRFTRISARDSTLRDGPEVPTPAAGGRMWVVFRDQIYEWHEGEYLPVQVAGLPSRGVRSLATAQDGARYVGYRDGRVFRTDGRKVENLSLLDAPSEEVTGIIPAPDGTVWVMYTRAILRWNGGRTMIVSPDRERAVYTAWTTDPIGGIWVASRFTGLWQLDAGGAVAAHVTANNLASSQIWALHADHEGSLWVGTDQGLERFRRTPFVSLTVPEGVEESQQAGVAWIDARAFWSVTRDGRVRRIRLLSNSDRGRTPDEETAVVTATTAPLRTVFGLAASADGGVWIGGGDRIERLRAGQASSSRIPADTNLTTVYDVLETRSGQVWAVAAAGVFRLERDRFRRFEPRNAARIRLPAYWGAGMLFEDRQGRVWVGGTDLIRIAGDSAVSFGRDRGFLGTHVTAIHEDTNGAVWVAGRPGELARIRNDRVATVPLGPGRDEVTVRGIAEDAMGHLWLASELGFDRVPIAQLDAAAGGKVVSFDRQTFTTLDGLPNHVPSGHRGIQRDADGRLWFSLAHSLAVVDPAGIPRNTSPPPVVIEELVVDDEVLDRDRAAIVKPGSYRYEFRFTANSLLIPERIRFRYRLDGAENEWTTVGGLQRRATYTRLAPGRYTFRVQAANNDGVWNHAGAAMAFRVLPAWYQTWWAIAAGLLLVAASAGGGAWTLARIRQDRQEARFRAMLEERSRMAREMHDTLLQGFTGITLQLQSLKGKLRKAPDTVEAGLTRLLEIADATLQSARLAVWEMRPPELERADLAEALRSVLQRITEGALTLRYHVTGTPRRLAPELETCALRVGAEAAANAVKHARANVLDVELMFGTDDVTLRLRDDGCGFDVDRAFTSGGAHLGLTGMRERARQISAQVTITSAVGLGTEVRLLALDRPVRSRRVG